MEYPSAPDAVQLEQILLQIATGQQLQAASLFMKRYMKSSISVGELLANILNSTKSSVRQLASVLLRKNIMKHWEVLGGKEEIKKALLEKLVSEPEALVIRNIASLIAHMAGQILSTWPELLSLVSTLCMDARPEARVVGLYLLAEILENEATCDFLRPHFGSLGQLLVKSLTDGGSFEIQKNALIAIGNLVINAAEEMGDLNPIVPLLLSVVSNSVDNKDEELVAYAFDIFDNLLDEAFNLSSHWESIVRLAMGKIGLNTQLELTTRESAMDFIESVAEDEPKTFTKNLDLLGWVLQSIFTIASECDDDPEETTPIDMAFRLLKTLAISLPNKYIFKPVVALVTANRHSQNERVRRAAIMAPGLIAEGCAGSLKPEIRGLLDMILPAFEDPSLAVKEGAAIALGYCSEHLQPDILEYHDEIIPALLASIDTPRSSVRNRVLFAIDTFASGCDEELSPRLQSIMQKLVQVVLQVPDNHSKQMALAALNTVINSAEQRSAPYFEDLVGLLLRLTQAEDDRGLVAISLHTLGQLAANCGKELYLPYFEASANLGIQFLQTDDLELREAGFAFFYLVSRVFKDTIVPYLPEVIAQALKTVESQKELAIEGSDSDSDESYAGKPFSHANSIELDEKTAAMHTLGHIALACPQAMPAFVGRLLTDLEFLWNHFHESIRLQSVTTYVQIVQALNQVPSQFSPDSETVWFEKVLPKYIHELTEDESDKVVNRVLENIEDLVEQIGASVLPENWLVQVLVKLQVILCENAACQRSFEDDEADSNEELMANVVTVIDIIIKTFKTAIQSYFDEMVPVIVKMIKPSKTSRIRVIFTGCLAEAFNQVPSFINRWARPMMELSLTNLASGDSGLQRNTCFLVGVVCAEAKEAVVEFYPAILTALQPFFTTETEPALIDNAVSAVARMLPVCIQRFPIKPLLDLWFSQLPIKDDFDETKTVLNAIVFLSKTTDLSAYVERTLEVLFDAILTNSVDPSKYKLPDDLYQSVVSLTSSLRSHESFQAVGSRLDSAQQLLLSQILA